MKVAIALVATLVVAVSSFYLGEKACGSSPKDPVSSQTGDAGISGAEAVSFLFMGVAATAIVAGAVSATRER